MKILNKVTVTGADDSIDPASLIPIQKKFPHIEFGILLSRSQMGRRRFPSKAWLNRLVAANFTSKLNLSGHICGQWVDDFLTGYMVDLDQIAPGLSEVFSRFQINTHAQPHQCDSGLPDVLNHLQSRGQTVIFQLDGADGSTIAKEAVSHGWSDKIAGLFDLSHGAGILPESWPMPIAGLPCGYAGGLSPDNVAAQLLRIEQVSSCGTWIDAETHLFDARGFSLEKVESFLEAATPWVK
jgi:hypothetical protein